VLVSERHRGVDVFGGGDALLEHADRLEPDRDAEARRRESGGVCHDDRCLAQRRDPSARGVDERGSSARTPHDLDERGGGHGVEEVHADEARRIVEHRGQLIDRDGGGVRGDRGVRGDVLFDASERIDLEGEIFRHGFDHECARGEQRGIRARGEALPILRDGFERRASGDRGIDRFEHAGGRRICRVGIAFDDGDPGACEQEGVCDAGAHASTAEHPDPSGGVGTDLGHRSLRSRKSVIRRNFSGLSNSSA
jgi:hypothetical protein